LEIIEVEDDELDLNKSELDRLDDMCKTTEIGFTQLAQNIPKPKVLSISSGNTISDKKIQHHYHKQNTTNLKHNLQIQKKITQQPTPSGQNIKPLTSNDQSKITFDLNSDNSSSSISSSQLNVIQLSKESNMGSSNDSNDGAFNDSFSNEREASNTSPYY
jgi:hypothetical protein